MNGIEEVKKIINNPDSSLGSYDLRVEKQAEQIDAYYSQLFPQPLDDKGTIISKEEMLGCSLIGKYPFEDVQDVIEEACKHQAEHTFALLQPKIEEAILQARKEQMLIDWAQAGKDVEEAEKRGADSGVKACASTCKSLIVEAVKKERERIFAQGDKLINQLVCSRFVPEKHRKYVELRWQALKGESK